MGSGRNGTFDKVPDLQQWAILMVHDEKYHKQNDYPAKKLFGKFIAGWFRFFGCEIFTFFLEPVKGHGKWDGRQPFDFEERAFLPDEPMATITRATIRLSKLKYFWQNVAAVANSMKEANGFIYSTGIGELPWIKQVTLSIWNSEKDMTNFAYGMKVHGDVAKRTRKEKWFSEDLFARFRVVHHEGTIRGIDPLLGKL